MSVSEATTSLGSAIGNIPDVHNQTSVTQTVTIAGTGQSTISVNNVIDALASQNTNFYNEKSNMYVHEIRAYGTAGGYLSMAPYPHRQYLTSTTSAGDVNVWVNQGNTSAGQAGMQLTQMYDFGVAGSSRPHLKWTYPKNETLNNPFTFGGYDASDTVEIGVNLCKICTVQSVNTTGDALYVLQFDITVQPNIFIPITSLVGAAAFGVENVAIDNYKAPSDKEKRIQEAEKAYATANKKRKVKHVKDMTMPSRDV